MIKKLKSSLFAKVFIITTFLLLLISLLVFGILAWIMPKTYLQELNNGLDAKVKEFVAELEQSTLENSGSLFDKFLSANDISNIELFSQSGEYIPVPTMPQEMQETVLIQGNTANRKGDSFFLFGKVFLTKVFCSHNLNISKLLYYEEIFISADNI